MCSLRGLPVVKNHNFWQILTLGAPVPTPCIDEAKFGVLQHTHGVRLRAKIRLDRFILSPSSGEKPHFLPLLPRELC